MASRVTQVTGEAVEKPSPNAAVTQVTGEAVESPSPNAVVTQVFAEAVYPKTDLPTRAIVTQVDAEAVVDPEPNAVVTQVMADAVVDPEPNAVVTQVFAEVVTPNVAPASFTLDAWLKAIQSASFTLDAFLDEGGGGGECDFDTAFQDDAFQDDAFQICTVTPTFTLRSLFLRTQSASFSLDAAFRLFIPSSYFLDAYILGLTSATFTLNAEIAQAQPFTLDAVIKAAQAASFALGAWIYSPRADPTGPGEPGETPLISIIVGGVDITDAVVFQDAKFTMLVNGAVGSCYLRVRDAEHTRNFTSGAEITVDIDGRRKFGGYILKPKRMLAFPADDTITDGPESVVRFHVLEGVDYNILFQKRVLYDHNSPADVGLREWPAGTRDDVIIRYVFDHYTDLGADGVTYNGVQHVGFPNPDKAGVVGSGGLRFGDAMREINRLISGVFYIDPFKDLNYVDVDIPDAEFGLSDVPTTGQVGYRDFDYTRNGSGLRNDALVWGAGLGSKDLTFGRVTDDPSIEEHGLWQYGEYTTALFRQTSVNLRAETVVYGTPQSKRGGKDDQESWTLTSFEPSFTAGQKVAIESEVHGFADVVPIRRMTLTFPTPTDIKQDLVLSHEIDEPWNMFEFLFPHIGVPGFEFPPIKIIHLPPRVCDPDDFLLGSTGGSFACVIPEVPGAQPTGCNTSANPVGAGTDYVFLYEGATYYVQWSLDYRNNVALHAYLAHNSGTPIGWEASGNVEQGTAQPFVRVEMEVPAGFGNDFWELHLDALPHSNYFIFGGAASAEVGYISGPDPRFEDIDCIDANDPGYQDNGQSQEGEFGDGVTTVFHTTAAYVPGSTRVFVNGWFQRPGGIEYTESNPAQGEITFVTAPAAGLSIVILYEAFGAPF